MIQQVIGIKNWQDFFDLTCEKLNLPLINNNFDLLISPFSTRYIIEKTTKNRNINSTIKHLNEMFETCYCPNKNIDNISFISDLRQIRVDNQHAFILVAMTLEELNDLYFLLKILDRKLTRYTLVIMNENLTQLESILAHSDNVHNWHQANYCVATYSTHVSRKWLHVIHYRHQDSRLSNKVVNLATNVETEWQTVMTMPTYLAKGSASDAFLERHDYQSFDTPVAVLSLLSSEQPAVVVFAAEQFSDLPEIARQTIALKQRFGKAVKVLVKEVKPCIRYHDFHLLVNSGVQATIEHAKTEGQLFDQIQLAYRTEMDQQANELEALLGLYQTPITQRGRLTFDAFKSAVIDGLHTLDGTQIEYALVELVPYSSLDVAHTAHYCQMRRQGDFYCHADGRLLLFFASLRRAEVTQAISNVFDARIEDLFSQQRTLTDKASIIELLSKINHIDRVLPDHHNGDDAPYGLNKPSRYAQKISWGDM